MKTPEEIAQWVIDNRYPQSEKQMVSDAEMYHYLIESIEKLCNLSDVSNSIHCPKCSVNDYKEYLSINICNKCDNLWDN